MTAYILLHTLVFVAYLAAGLFYGANISLRDSVSNQRARLLFLIGVVLHTAAIGAFCVEVKRSPFANGFGTLSVASWTVALLYLPLELRGRIQGLGALAVPLCLLLLFVGVLRSRTSGFDAPEIGSKLVSSHVLMILASFAFFTLAACCAVFYLWQYSVLKHPHRGSLFRRLPPLETVDATAFHLVAFALPLLTLGIVLGIVRVAESGAGNWNWLADPHTIISLVAWVVYAGYLFARLALGWRGTRLNYLLIAGLAVTLALYFVPSSTHQFN